MEQTIQSREVSIIPATKRSMENGGQLKKQQELRVAAYCRVSTGDESQQTSYATQRQFYTDLITDKPGWLLAGIYADEAISGTSRAKRKRFNEMMEDALHGKIDYIITKSISRFARNTLDTLNCVRQLRQLDPPVGIYFEKENIDTLDAAGELILTILSALAQDESRSISDNIRWSFQKKFQRGEAIIDLNRFLGYDKGPNGEWLINPEQAETVRYIFSRFIRGANSSQIARELNETGKKTLRGCIWRADAILRILRNEKYVGDCECQKTITKNFLTHKSTVNTGEAPRYYIENHHVGIIDRLTWDRAQAILRENGRRKAPEAPLPEKRRGAAASPFSNLICEAAPSGRPCSHRLRRLCYNNLIPDYADRRCAAAEGLKPSRFRERYYFSYPVWRCAGSECGTEPAGQCPIGTVFECALEQSFMELLYQLKRDHAANGEHSLIAEAFRKACGSIQHRDSSNTRSLQRLELLDLQIRELEEALNQTLAKQNAALDSPDTALLTSAAADRRRQIADLKKERRTLEAEQGPIAAMRKNYDFFLRCLAALPETNEAGLPLRVNGLDTEIRLPAASEAPPSDGLPAPEESMPNLFKAPDYLPFEKGIYLAFIQKGVLTGDTIVYTTNFGALLTVSGNLRSLNSFLGFRRASTDGTMELLDAGWKVHGKNICYSRKPIRRSRRKRPRRPS